MTPENLDEGSTRKAPSQALACLRLQMPYELHMLLLALFNAPTTVMNSNTKRMIRVFP